MIFHCNEHCFHGPCTKLSVGWEELCLVRRTNTTRCPVRSPAPCSWQSRSVRSFNRTRREEQPNSSWKKPVQLPGTDTKNKPGCAFVAWRVLLVPRWCLPDVDVLIDEWNLLSICRKDEAAEALKCIILPPNRPRRFFRPRNKGTTEQALHNAVVSNTSIIFSALIPFGWSSRTWWAVWYFWELLPRPRVPLNLLKSNIWAQRQQSFASVNYFRKSREEEQAVCAARDFSRHIHQKDCLTKWSWSGSSLCVEVCCEIHNKSTRSVSFSCVNLITTASGEWKWTEILVKSIKRGAFLSNKDSHETHVSICAFREVGSRQGDLQRKQVTKHNFKMRGLTGILGTQT